MITPQVTVVVPCYNQAHYLADALGSILAQTFRDWECIVVNDGSQDNTIDVVRTWVERDSRFRYIEKANGGLSSARNAGIMAARGDFLQFLDADDLLEVEKLAWQIQTLNDNPHTAIVYSDVRYFSEDAPQESRFSLFDPDEPWVEPAWLDPRPFFEKLLEDNMMAVNCPMLRRSVINRVGLFDEKMHALEDWHYWLRCAAKGVAFQFAQAPNTLALVRIHPASMSQNRARMRHARYEKAVRVGSLLKDPGLRRKNFDVGLHSMTADRGGVIEYQLLRLAWANRGFNILRPLVEAILSRRPRISKLVAFLVDACHSNAQKILK